MIEFNIFDKTVLDLNKTQCQPQFGGIGSCTKTGMCLHQRLIHSIGMDKIRSAAMNNEPMQSWSADPRTRGFRDGKFSTVDLEALISLDDNFDKFDAKEKQCYSSASLLKHF
jgi:hypothetical protein